ncbi:unnamed protein product, partial [Ectocarpus sp. 13 AM-2016]
PASVPPKPSPVPKRAPVPDPDAAAGAAALPKPAATPDGFFLFTPPKPAPDPNTEESLLGTGCADKPNDGCCSRDAPPSCCSRDAPPSTPKVMGRVPWLPTPNVPPEELGGACAFGVGEADFLLPLTNSPPP